MRITLAPLEMVASTAVESLLDAAFGTDRHMRTAYRIRSGTDAIGNLSFAATVDDRLVGTLQSWPVQIAGHALVLVGPVAVHPDAQRTGIGRALMEQLLTQAPDQPMTMIGDPEYYGRFFGFTATPTAGWIVPGPVDRHRLLARNVSGFPVAGPLGPRIFATTPSSP